MSLLFFGVFFCVFVFNEGKLHDLYRMCSTFEVNAFLWLPSLLMN